ncbi:hypothetical protein DL764_010496 [Monosporascus ibericus]|uniref:Mediator of RNA polymerase II transcription subunit 9 n=1 Tax=Monosporascus ibericus TaxID=155417 RepID=A0A4Q4SUQ8_9PEZI|nr:hypothetical protein DL764_010496 [Monosporascus ibericus]
MTSTNTTTTLAMPPGLNPSTLDTITELAQLLARLRTPASLSATSTNLPGGTPAATQTTPASSSTAAQHQHQQHQQQHHQHQHQPQLHPPQSQTQSQPQSQPGQGQAQDGELSLKEVPAAADALKHRFQRARAQIRTLPDMGRGVAEQEAEMAALEARLARQREVLARLRDVGVRFAAAQGERDGDGETGGGDRMALE